MKFQFDIADRTRTVEIRRGADGIVISVDGEPRRVDAVRIGEDAWSLVVLDPAVRSPRSVDAAITPQPGNGGVDVQIDGRRIGVHLRDARARRKGAAAAAGAGAQRVTAPMPGKVVRVPVQSGQHVKARQVLVVVEAMKMENELRAARDGIVSQVFVREGQSVDAGAALVTVE
jgi:biotin carboxyl carrier protein